MKSIKIVLGLCIITYLSDNNIFTMTELRDLRILIITFYQNLDTSTEWTMTMMAETTGSISVQGL